MGNQRDWPHDLEKIREMVYEEILPEWRSSEHNSRRQYPSARWLTDNGYSHLRWVLSEHHDIGLEEFFETVLNLTGEQKSSFDWDIDDPETIKHALDFLQNIRRTRDLADDTYSTYRSILNGSFRHFTAYHGEMSLYGLANDPSRKEETYEMFEEMIYRIKQNRPDSTVYSYLRLLQRFYEWLERRHRIKYNPVEGLEEEFNFDLDSITRPLTSDEVRKLWNEADELDEYILIVGYVFWGLRTEELARMRVDQFILDEDDPRYEFKKRKNGPGVISVEHGLLYLAERIERLETKSDFDGSLYNVHKKTLKRRFNRLAERADVMIDGKPANPTHGRNFWMNLYEEANLLLLESIEEIIPDRGSKDPKTALESYTTEKTHRKYRRLVFRSHLEEILPEEEPLTPTNYISDIENQHQIGEYLQEELIGEDDIPLG